MNAKARTAKPPIPGLLLLALLSVAPGAVPSAFAADDAAAEAEGEKKGGPRMSPEARIIGDPEHPDWPAEGSFSPGPSYEGIPYDGEANLAIYDAKRLNPTPDPPVELGRRLYDRGAYKPRPTWLGARNPIGFSFLAYGDFRLAAAYNDNGVPAPNGKTEQSTLAARLNLDLDFAFTATERLHVFVRPFDDAGSFTRYEFSGGVEDEFVDELDFKIETLFFEGDLGAIRAGRRRETNMIDLPIAVGLVPIITQNGIWIEDAFEGVAFGITAKNSPSLDISNFDLTFFAGFNKVTTAAVADDDDAKIFGLAGFADLLKGYLEFGYGYVDADRDDLSYHNVTAAFSRRFGATLSNSVRVIGNFGQSPAPGRVKTADGVLVLIENSLITSKPLTLVPYINLFAGFDTPQSLARSGDSGGVLRNTGINFESDGMTGYPTLDARGHDAYGGAVGVEYLFNLDRQIVVEVAAVERTRDLGRVLGSEYAVGLRYQHPISNAMILRFDAMAGWREDPSEDILGARFELRRKF